MNLQQTQSHGLRRGAPQRSIEERWAAGLGWFSIGLGAAEVIAPRTMAKLIGVNGRDTPVGVLRTYGLREIAAGVGILSQPKPVGWMWGRVAGDLMDLASLRSASRSDGAHRARIALATTAVLGVAAMDVYCSTQMTRKSAALSQRGPSPVTRSVIVGKSPEEVYQFWRNLQNLPTVMDRLESVEMREGGRSHWKFRTPLGKTIEWDAEITADEPGSRIAWRSLEGSPIDISGSVKFERAPGGRGTLVRCDVEFGSSLAALAGRAGKLGGVGAGDQIEQCLRQVKQVLETGEIARSDASVHWTPHAAQPAHQ